MMFRAIAVFGVMGALSGCSDSGPNEAARRQEAERREYVAAREAETKQMSDPRLGAQVLESRLGEWIRPEPGGVVSIEDSVGWSSWRTAAVPGGEFYRWLVLPASTPWTVRCDSLGIDVNLVPGNEHSIANVTLHITDAELTKEHCKQLAPAVGRKLRQLFGAQ